MKKIKLNKLGINKATISHLTMLKVNGGGTYTCPGASCCPPTLELTCADTCNCPPTETIRPLLCGGTLESIRTCPA